MLSRSRTQLVIAVVAALLFVPGLGAVHLFDWDEINFAEIAREMIASGDWLRPQMQFERFHEKPPLFMWMQALSMSVFGVGEFAARLPNAVCGICTLLLLFRIGTQLRGPVFGTLWALAYAGSILPHLYFRSGIIDPWFNLFIFLGLHSVIMLVKRPQTERPSTTDAPADRYAWLAGLFLGLAILTKGPVGVLVPGLVVAAYWVMGRGKAYVRWRHLVFLGIALLTTTGAWAVVDLLRNGPEFISAFFWRQVAMLTTEDAGHGGFFGYHFVVLLVGCFPASVFALQELIHPTRSSEGDTNDHRRWMVILFWVVLILFSLVKTKIVHYSSLCYFPITFLAALRLENAWQKREGFGWSRFLIGAIGVPIAVVVLALPFVGMNIDQLVPLFANDPFAQANLQADINWNGWEALAGALLLIALIMGHYWHYKGHYRQALLSVFGGTALFVTAALFFLINNIEGYSQRAAVEFFQSKADERCWLVTVGYKSYVPEFYGRVQEPMPGTGALMTGPIDRPVYLACKVTDVDEVVATGTFSELYRRNGFVFYRRLQ